MNEQHASDQQTMVKNVLDILAHHSGYSLHPERFHYMYLECMGIVHFYIGIHPVTVHDWRQYNRSHAGWKKALAVLAYLALRGRQGATSDELIDTIWHGHAQKNTLARTIAALRRIIQYFSDEQFASQVLSFEQHRYALSPTLCTSDVDIFMRTIRYAEQQEYNGHQHAALTAYALASALYRGPYLQSLDLQDELVDMHRTQLLHSFLFALDRQIELYQERSQYHRCIELCYQGLQHCPYDPDLTLHLLRCYEKLHQFDKIHQVYNQYMTALQHVIESDDPVVEWMRQRQPASAS